MKFGQRPPNMKKFIDNFYSKTNGMSQRSLCVYPSKSC